MPRYSLKNLPFPDRLDAKSMVSNLRTAWENFIKIDQFKTVSVASGTTVLTAISQTIFADATAGNITLTVPSAVGNAGLTFNIFKTDTTTNTVTIDGNVLGANGGRSRLILIGDGAVWRVQLVYEEGFYTATLTGCATSPTTTIYYIKNGKSVDVKSTATLQATSNTTAATLTGMPSHLYPGTTLDFVVPSIRDSGLTYVGTVEIDTAGVWTLIYQATASSRTAVFANTGTKGIGMFSASYTLQ